MLRPRARAPSRSMVSNAGCFCCPIFCCYSHSFLDPAVCLTDCYILEERNLSNAYITAPQSINPSFSGHQTFPFRYTWLKKGIDAVTENPTVFSSENASVTLGVGKNMVDSIRHWCRASGLIETNTGQRNQLFISLAEKGTSRQSGQFVPTDLGEAIFGDQTGFDPYLDDPATLWLIHWQIATNTNQATAWYWAFNILRGNQFTPHIFARELHKWARQQKHSMRPVSENTLQRDVNCFIRTYCQSRHSETVVEETFDCPLAELNLIVELPDGSGYEFQRGNKETLPIEVVTWALNTFWRSHFSRQGSLSFSHLMYDPLSPGRVFRLDEDTMTTHLENLGQLTEGAWEYDETAGLKQVRRHRDLNQMELLKRYYA